MFSYSPKMRILFVLSLVFLCGCAIGNKYPYDTLNIDYSEKISASVSIFSLDNRPYVVSGDKKPNFVGLQRGGYGNPFDVNTVSGRPLVEELAKALKSALEGKGARVDFQPYKHLFSEQQALSAIAGSGAPRSLLLDVREWKSDILVSFSLKYDLRLSVYDESGNLLGEERLVGNDVLGSSFWNPVFKGEDAVMHHARLKLSELLNSDKIKQALKS